MSRLCSENEKIIPVASHEDESVFSRVVKNTRVLGSDFQDLTKPHYLVTCLPDDSSYPIGDIVIEEELHASGSAIWRETSQSISAT